MKLYVLSDLLNDCHPFDVAVHAHTWRTQADVVVLAGDINQGLAGIEGAATTFVGLPVVHVAGNNELYDCDWERAPVQMRAAAKRHFVRFLENGSVERREAARESLQVSLSHNRFATPNESGSILPTQI